MECSFDRFLSMYEYIIYALKRKNQSKYLNYNKAFNFKKKPANDSEFCKRAGGRGPKDFLWLLMIEFF